MTQRPRDEWGWVREQVGRTVVLKAVGKFGRTETPHTTRAVFAIGPTRARLMMIDLSQAQFAHDGFDAWVMVESLYYSGFRGFHIGVVATGNAAASLIKQHVVAKVYSTREDALADRRSWAWHSRLAPASPMTARNQTFRRWCQYCGHTATPRRSGARRATR